jgi:hypothetical protein
MAKKSDENVVKAKSLFDHLGGITYKKEKWESLSEMDKKSFEMYMVNRFLSMNLDYLELVNEIQRYTNGQLKPRELYKVYLDTLPKKKSFDKYVKGKSESKWDKNVIKYLCQYYQVSSREVEDYLEILSKDEVLTIIQKYGIKKEEIQKWLK